MYHCTLEQIELVICFHMHSVRVVNKVVNKKVKDDLQILPLARKKEQNKT